MCLKNPFAVNLLFLVMLVPSMAVFAGTDSPFIEVSVDTAADRMFLTEMASSGPAWLSATNVSISGRVKTPEGRPIKGASVVLKDAETNAVIRNTLSSNFGFYRLDQIETGRLYVLSVWHRRYLFAFPAQLLEINEDRTGVDFTGETDQ